MTNLASVDLSISLETLNLSAYNQNLFQLLSRIREVLNSFSLPFQYIKQMDVCSDESVEKAVKEVLDTEGRIDVWWEYSGLVFVMSQCPMYTSHMSMCQGCK